MLLVAIGILCLQAATGIEPVLYTRYIMGLFVAHRCVAVDVVVGSDDIEPGTYVVVGCGIEPVAAYTTVFACQVLAAQAQGFCLYDTPPAAQRLRS